MINRFMGKYKDFSNFEPARVKFENLAYPTVEHAYVAAKSLDRSFRRDVAMMPPNKAGQVKKWGRTIKLRDDWDQIKLHVMEDLIVQKFNMQNDYHRHKLLLETGDQLIVEGNYWHDNFWGNCLCEKCAKIKGENHLGLILMKVREFYSLRDEGYANVEITS